MKTNARLQNKYSLDFLLLDRCRRNLPSAPLTWLGQYFSLSKFLFCKRPERVLYTVLLLIFWILHSLVLDSKLNRLVSHNRELLLLKTRGESQYVI